MATCKNCLHYGICTFHITGNENEKCPHYTPTADVVPKSKYDAVVNALDNSTKEFLRLHDDYQEAKCEIDKWTGRCRDWHEVAAEKSKLVREIFEEIEKTVFADMDFFKELKNKYTEGKT